MQLGQRGPNQQKGCNSQKSLHVDRLYGSKQQTKNKERIVDIAKLSLEPAFTRTGAEGRLYELIV